MSTTDNIDEFELIRRVFYPLGEAQPFSLGLADDAAIITPTPGSELCLSTDTLSDGVHFRLCDGAESVAARCLASNVSDLAAMGATPVGYTLAIASPADLSIGWFEAFARQLAEDQKRYGIGLIGGDTTHSAGPLVLTLTVIGEAPTGCSVRRAGASRGDDIWITGTIGDAALGLDILRRDITSFSDRDREVLTRRFCFPDARISAAVLVRENATAAIDVSDGLIADVGHIASACGLNAHLKLDRIPVSDAARRLLDRPGADDLAIWSRMLSGGDDYELVFMAPPERCPVIRAVASALPYALTRCGTMTPGHDAGSPVRVLDSAGEILDVPGSGGYRHFASGPTPGQDNLNP